MGKTRKEIEELTGGRQFVDTDYIVRRIAV